MQPKATDPILMHILWLIVDILKVFLGAFFGAAFAFAYECRRKKNEELSQRIISLRDSQFALVARVNSLLIINKQYLKMQAQNPNRWIELSPVLNVLTPPPIPLAEISFLLDDIDPNLLGEILVARNKYDTVCQIIAIRNRKHNEFQELYERGVTSKRLQTQLTDFTDALYYHLPSAVTFIHSVHSMLEEVMKKHFRVVKILRFEPESEQMIKELQQQNSLDEGKACR